MNRYEFKKLIDRIGGSGIKTRATEVLKSKLPNPAYGVFPANISYINGEHNQVDNPEFAYDKLWSHMFEGGKCRAFDDGGEGVDFTLTLLNRLWSSPGTYNGLFIITVPSDCIELTPDCWVVKPKNEASVLSSEFLPMTKNRHKMYILDDIDED